MELDKRYRVYRNKNQVIVITHYRGKSIKGVAKCSPEDEFDLERGTAIAKCRCDLKLMNKKQMDDAKQYIELRSIHDELTDRLEAIGERFITRGDDMDSARDLLHNLTRA